MTEQIVALCLASCGLEIVVKKVFYNIIGPFALFVEFLGIFFNCNIAELVCVGVVKFLCELGVDNYETVFLCKSIPRVKLSVSYSLCTAEYKKYREVLDIACSRNIVKDLYRPVCQWTVACVFEARVAFPVFCD